MTDDIAHARLRAQRRALADEQARRRREGWHASEGERLACAALDTALDLLGVHQ